jgi:hypothetical protein
MIKYDRHDGACTQAVNIVTMSYTQRWSILALENEKCGLLKERRSFKPIRNSANASHPISLSTTRLICRTNYPGNATQFRSSRTFLYGNAETCQPNLKLRSYNQKFYSEN